jgi:enamine deaminase RidA (YjgF/YER057c/UK114 family)
MADSLSQKIATLGLELPQAAAPAANYVPYVTTGTLVFISGQLPQRNGIRPFAGRLGAEISIEAGVEAARLCGLNLLAWLREIVSDDLDRVGACVRLGGFVSATPEFFDHPKVINGASDLMVGVLGERGRHARTAVGVSSLPFNVPVEVDAIFALR